MEEAPNSLRGAQEGAAAAPAPRLLAAGEEEPNGKGGGGSTSSSEEDLVSHSGSKGGALRSSSSGRRAPSALADLDASVFFDLEHPVTTYEAAKMLLMLPVVLVKLAYLAVAVVYAWAVLRVLLLGHKLNTPMHPLRRVLVREWVRAWAHFLLFLGFFNMRVSGWENVEAAKRERAILTFNHPSYVDAAVMAALFTPAGISKAGVAQLPFIGLFARALQLFFVARRGTSDKDNPFLLKSDPIQAIADRAADPRFPLVMIAPEATTKARPCLLKFRKGAFATGRPVCPVLISYSYRHFNPQWGIVFTPLHVYRLLAQFVNHVSVEVLPPYHPSEEERRDPALFAANVWRLMGERLGVPLVEQGVAEERELSRSGVQPNLRGTRLVIPPARHKAE